MDGRKRTFNTDFLSTKIAQVLQQDVFPVASVGDESQVRQRFLWRSDFAFFTSQQIWEVYEKSAVALSLVRRKSQDTRHVVVQEWIFLLKNKALLDDWAVLWPTIFENIFDTIILPTTNSLVVNAR